MKAIIKTYNETGCCEIHVPKVVKAWTDKFTILKRVWYYETHGIGSYGTKYTLVQYRKNGKGTTNLKIEISETQALELISLLDLKCIVDITFRKAWSYKQAGFIKTEIERLKEIHRTKSTEFLASINLEQKNFNNLSKEQQEKYQELYILINIINSYEMALEKQNSFN
jgi:hypothetical protein